MNNRLRPGGSAVAGELLHQRPRPSAYDRNQRDASLIIISVGEGFLCLQREQLARPRDIQIA